MKPLLTLKSSVLGFSLLCIAATSSALTLGRIRGAVMLGQPLQVSVPVQLDSEEGAATPCLDADVFYGDVRLEAGRVSVNADATGPSSTLMVRVSADARVDEPVVTVYLRAGCGQKTSRRYVLLADLASEVAPPVPAALPVAKPAVASSGASRPSVAEPARAPIVSQEPAPKAEASPAKAVAAAKKSVRVAAEKVESKASAPRSTGVAIAGSKQSRLKLSALDFPERDPALKFSNALPSAPLEDLQKRVEAVAQWRSLNATPQDVLRDDARLQALEGDLKSLQELTSKNRRTLSDIANRLEQAESQRYANPLVYGMAVLLLVASAGLLLVWVRWRSGSRGAAPWWRDSVQAESVARHSTRPPSDFEGPNTQAPITAAPEGVDIDLDLDAPVFSGTGLAAVHGGVPQNPPAVASVAETSVSDHQGFTPSNLGPLRAIKIADMLDVRQQAEFFMTLGQYEEAIGLLKSHVSESGEANPLVYLDLLKVFHTLSRKDEYDHYREDFNRLFTGHVPAYTGFNRGGKGLEDYPQVCRRIVALWPSHAVLFIEQCLVRSGGDDETQIFDLEAYRELLMLHSVARRLDGGGDSALAPFSTAKHLPDLGPADATQPMDTVATGAQTSLPSVDLDLSVPMHNLIDFEVSGFSKIGDLSSKK